MNAKRWDGISCFLLLVDSTIRSLRGHFDELSESLGARSTPDAPPSPRGCRIAAFATLAPVPTRQVQVRTAAGARKGRDSDSALAGLSLPGFFGPSPSPGVGDVTQADADEIQ